MKFEKFLLEEEEEKKFELDILRAAHKYSTKREFDIIKGSNGEFPGIDKIGRNLRDEVAEYNKFKAINELKDETDFYEGLCLIEQLRYINRWSQTPRMPKTSVLGHSMYTALIVFFISRDMKACPKRIVNNFYAALFHDLPESVTRDIISPVKQATNDFPDIIKQIEKEICNEELYTKFPKAILNELRYILGDIEGLNSEFFNRIIENGQARPLIGDEEKDINGKYNKNEYSPIDGRLIKLSDHIAAYMEAQKSIDYGISSHHLQDGLANLRKKYLNEDNVPGVNVKRFFNEFN